MLTILDIMEVDETGMIQCTVEREDGSFVVTTFVDRAQLLQFAREDAIYGTDPRLIAGSGGRTVLRH